MVRPPIQTEYTIGGRATESLKGVKRDPAPPGAVMTQREMPSGRGSADGPEEIVLEVLKDLEGLLLGEWVYTLSMKFPEIP